MTKLCDILEVGILLRAITASTETRLSLSRNIPGITTPTSTLNRSPSLTCKHIITQLSVVIQEITRRCDTVDQSRLKINLQIIRSFVLDGCTDRGRPKWSILKYSTAETTHTFVAFAELELLCHLETTKSQPTKLSITVYVTFVTMFPLYPEPLTESYTSLLEV